MTPTSLPDVPNGLGQPSASGADRALPAFPYRLEAKVGEGSMGVVYRALEPALGRPVAIKVLKIDSGVVGADVATEEMRLRFLQEARSAAAIQHPGAVTIYRVGQTNGLPYIAMEWLEGETLAARLARVGRLALHEAVDLAVQTLDALQAAHDVGVIHRDIKPANLILLKGGRVKVADFGIARFRGANLLRTQSGVMLGTPANAAPEQLRGEEVDARSDLFSLGMVLYEALTGELPFRASSLLELASKVLRETPAPIGGLRPDLPPAAVQVVTRALTKDRAQRWASAREMAQALLAAVPSPAARALASSAAVADSGAVRGATIALPRPESGPVYRGLPSQLSLALAHLVLSWPGQSLAAQPLDRLLARLLEKPLHTAAFSGGLAIGGRLLLLHDGRVVGAIDRRSGLTGDDIVEELAGEASSQLHPVADGLPARTLEVLAGLLAAPRVRQGGLDSAIVNLAGLADKLAEEHFDGVLRLRRDTDEGRIVLVGGQSVLAFFSGAWAGVDVERAWTSWVGEIALALDVEEVSARPLDITWSLRARDLELTCERRAETRASRPGGGSGSLATRRMPLLASRLEPKPERVVLTPARELEGSAPDWRQAPPARLLEWLLTEGAAHFADSKVAARWKYLAEWLPLVRRAQLYADLSQDGRGGRWRRFNVATLDAAGKVLHLAHRFARVTPDRFRQVLARAVEEKEARTGGGDIGGVIFAAPEFPPDVIALYLETIEHHASGFRRLQENVTGYAGFVRVGPRRGFHLLLVEERDGTFAPLDV